MVLNDVTPATTRSFQSTWKTIKLGTRGSITSLKRELQDSARRLTACAAELIECPGMELSPREYEIVLHVVTPRQLGLECGTKLGRIYEQAHNAGYAPCPNEVGPQLHLQCEERAFQGVLRIAMSPIEHRGMAEIFALGHDSAGRYLDCGIGSPGYFFFSPDEKFVFVKQSAHD